MKLFLSILLILSCTASAQTVTRTGAYRGAAVPKATGGTDWSAIVGLATNQSGYPVLAWYRAESVRTNTNIYLDDSWTNSWHLVNSAAGGTWPTYSATGGPNSKPMLTFDGSDDYLKNTSYTSSQPHEVFMVANLRMTGNPVYFDGVVVGGRNAFSTVSPYTTLQVQSATAATAADVSTTGLTNNWVIYDVIFYSTAESTIYTNNVSRGKGDSGSNPANGFTLAARYNLGAGRFGPMDVAEIISYGGASGLNAIPGTNAVARSNVWYYLKTKYGL